ncbi:MAG TPA: choice-of-anchor D domain-containing protein [Fimbriimonadaceae bacterium]|nr:choice-of-anchor D domain-containing protein [Fimbriimonadaceae bacterium]
MFRRAFLLVLVVAAVVFVPFGGSAASASSGVETDVVLQYGQKSLFFVPSAATTIRVYEEYGDLSALRADVYVPGASYFVTMEAPQGQKLGPGDYGGTVGNSSSPDAPTLDLSYNSRDCPGAGHFRIQSLTTDAQGNVTSFAATFELDCGSYAFGEIRYNVAGDGGNVIVGPQDMWWPDAETDVPAITAPVTVANPGPGAVTMGVSSVSGPDAADDVIASDGCAGVTLQAGDSCQVSVTYEPLAAGASQATLNVPEQGGAAHTVALDGIVSAGLTSGAVLTTSGNAAGRGTGYFFRGGTISLNTYARGRNGVSVYADDGTNGFGLVFGAAPGQPFIAGAYNNAHEGSSLDTQPYMAITGTGVGCQAPTGNFDVHEITVQPSGIISSLWVTFEQTCAGGPDEAFGEIRYNEPVDAGSAVVEPLNIKWPTAQTDSVPLTVPVTVWNPGPASVQPGAASISGPDAADDSVAADNCAGKTLAAGDTCTVSITYQPLVAGDNQAILSIPEQGGATHTIALTGFVSSGRTQYSLQSDAGDFVGQGLTYSYVPRNATFSASLGPWGNGRQLLQTIWTGTDGNFWVAQFSPPIGEQLTVGTTYTDTSLSPSTTGATMTFAGPGGCGAETGAFKITDLAVDAFGNLQRMGVQFVHYCDGTTTDPLAGPALRGTLQYQANYIDTATHGTTLNVSGQVSPNAPGKTVTVALQRKTRSGKWIAAATKHLRLGKSSDYSTSFTRPKAKLCRAVATFAPTNKQLASRTIKPFSC